MDQLLGKTEAQLVEYARAQGEAAFRGKQLYANIYKRRVLELATMTEFSKALRERLAQSATVTSTSIKDIFHSEDGTRRYLLRLGDDAEVEAVFIPEERRDTICISSQVGCAVGCTFCMTAQLGIKRNMTAGEIVSQVMVVLNDVYGPGVETPHGTNLVFMGMGESFLNYDELMSSIRLITDENGLGVSARRITVSTSGIIPRIVQYATESVRPRLAISLTATTDELRNEIIPINKRYPLADLMQTCREYPLGDRERLTFEYVMLDGVNDTDDDARRLTKLLRNIRAKVNLIPYNPAPELSYRSSPIERILAFQQILVDTAVPTFIRRPRGQDISAACGQLAARAR
ncbi:MAG: 23S rRNA (adenine(2503)-C(2))-methyltransferase RlmN [Acidobacteriota bacterium]